MAKNPVDRKTAAALSREGKITALTLLKNFYDEEIFTLLVKEFYNSDIGISEAAIRASGSLGNEIAIPHLYQIIERGRKSQRIAAIQALMAIRAPSSTGMLVKYFNHFPEEELRTEILRALNTISPTAQQVMELNHAVYVDSKQSEAVKRIAVEALVESERYSLLQDSLTKAPPAVQEAAFTKMLQTGSQEVLDLTRETLPPAALGCYLCVYTLKAKNPQGNYVLDMLQKAERQTVYSFLQSLSQFQGRLRVPTRVFRLLLICPYADSATEALVGDFLKKIVGEVKSASPHLLSEFSVITSAHLDTVFTKIRKNYISLQGITNKEVLLATVLATLLEKYATPSVLAEVQAFFKDDSSSGRTPPIAQMRSLLASAPKEELNRFEACIPLFAFTEKKDRLAVLTQVLRVDTNRPFFIRRLNRLIRVAGALEIKTTAKKIQEILEFARAERIHFLEETCIVTLCQLLTRSIIEASREFFKEPSRNIRTLNGYIRGARFIPAKIMIGPLIHILQSPALNPQSRLLAAETLENMDLAGLKRALPPLLKVVDTRDSGDTVKLRVGDVLARYGDSSIGHQALDLTSHGSAVGRRVAVRILKALVARGEGAPADIVTNRLYLLLEDADRSVRVEALLALLSMKDDYAAQIVSDFIVTGDAQIIAEILAGITRPLSRETFALVLDMIRLDSLPVQEALRVLLPELSQGSFAEELRQGLLAALTVVPGDVGKPGGADIPVAPAAAPGLESMLSQAKLEFKFRRENTQVLTVFFIDIVDYTGKSSSVDMSSLLKLIKAFEEIVGASIAAHRGTIVKKMGDGILAVFKHPLNATMAALAVQQKISEYSAMRVEQEKFQARIGLNTGPVIRKDNDIFGEVVNVASRMQSAATPGDVLLTEATFQEVRDYVRCTELGKIQVKGIKDAITAYSPEEVTVDLSKLAETGDGPGKEKGALRDSSLEKLKETIFNPTFALPAEKAVGEIPRLLKGIFSEISRAIEEIASDYHEEYAFKKYLQEKWDTLMGSL
jgi:class 3 adenylate cyclase/HEAT repeat protein